MASAIKCDRCESYYDKLETTRQIGGYRIDGIKVTTRNTSTHIHYDLCAKCIEDLFVFLNMIDTAEEE